MSLWFSAPWPQETLQATVSYIHSRSTDGSGRSDAIQLVLAWFLKAHIIKSKGRTAVATTNKLYEGSTPANLQADHCHVSVLLRKYGIVCYSLRYRTFQQWKRIQLYSQQWHIWALSWLYGFRWLQRREVLITDSYYLPGQEKSPIPSHSIWVRLYMSRFYTLKLNSTPCPMSKHSYVTIQADRLLLCMLA